MEVTIHNTTHLRHVRNYRHNLGKIKSVQRKRHVLKCLKIIIIRIYQQTHAVGRFQFKVGRESHIWREQDIVIRIYAERLISKHMLPVIKRDADTSCFHHGKST